MGADVGAGGDDRRGHLELAAYARRTAVGAGVLRPGGAHGKRLPVLGGQEPGLVDDRGGPAGGGGGAAGGLAGWDVSGTEGGRSVGRAGFGRAAGAGGGVGRRRGAGRGGCHDDPARHAHAQDDALAGAQRGGGPGDQDAVGGRQGEALGGGERGAGQVGAGDLELGGGGPPAGRGGGDLPGDARRGAGAAQDVTGQVLLQTQMVGGGEGADGVGQGCGGDLGLGDGRADGRENRALGAGVGVHGVSGCSSLKRLNNRLSRPLGQ